MFPGGYIVTLLGTNIPLLDINIPKTKFEGKKNFPLAFYLCNTERDHSHLYLLILAMESGTKCWLLV